jgi:hypothetical protein
MHINGQPFTVSTIRNDNLRRLFASAGNFTLLPKFRPVRFPHSTYIWRLLYHGLFCHVICCFLTGDFVLYMAGVFNAYSKASLFIAMTPPCCVASFERIPTPWTISTSTDFSSNFRARTMIRISSTTISGATILGCPLFLRDS